MKFDFFYAVPLSIFIDPTFVKSLLSLEIKKYCGLHWVTVSFELLQYIHTTNFGVNIKRRTYLSCCRIFTPQILVLTLIGEPIFRQHHLWSRWIYVRFWILYQEHVCVRYQNWLLGWEWRVVMWLPSQNLYRGAIRMPYI